MEEPEKNKARDDPYLRDNVMVSAGAKVLGSFTIGEIPRLERDR